jgi:hypothetical protein
VCKQHKGRRVSRPSRRPGTYHSSGKPDPVRRFGERSPSSAGRRDLGGSAAHVLSVARVPELVTGLETACYALGRENDNGREIGIPIYYPEMGELPHADSPGPGASSPYQDSPCLRKCSGRPANSRPRPNCGRACMDRGQDERGNMMKEDRLSSSRLCTATWKISRYLTPQKGNPDE